MHSIIVGDHGIHGEELAGAFEQAGMDVHYPSGSLADQMHHIDDRTTVVIAPAHESKDKSFSEKLLQWKSEGDDRSLIGVFRNQVELEEHREFFSLCDDFILADSDAKERSFRVQKTTSRLSNRVRSFTKASSAVPVELLSNFTSLLETISDGIVVMNEEARFVYANRAFRQMFEIGEGELDGSLFDEGVRIYCEDGSLCAPEDSPSAKAIRTGEEQRNVVIRVCVPGKEERLVNVSALPLQRSGSTKIRGAITCVTDITKSESLQEEVRSNSSRLQQLQKLESLGTLAGAIAHDFNNVLVPILSNAELLEAISDQEPIRKRATSIRACALRARELVARILKFARRSESGSISFDLIPIVSEISTMMADLLGPQIEVVCDLSDQSCVVMGNKDQLFQALMNLCTNAMHAMECSPRKVLSIRVSTADSVALARSGVSTRDRDYVVLSIEDTGCGMDESIQAKIFDAFYTTKAEGVGTGLGLASVKSIVTSMEGAVLVDSEIGRGTRFDIVLPRAEGRNRGEAKTRVIRRTQRALSGKVLLIDDEPTIREIVSDSLLSMGLEVCSFNDPLKAVEYYEYERPEIHVVVTDQSMPGMRGTEVANRLRSLGYEGAVILLTGMGSTVTSTVPLHENINAILPKPVTLDELYRQMRIVLGHDSTDRLTPAR